MLKNYHWYQLQQSVQLKSKDWMVKNFKFQVVYKIIKYHCTSTFKLLINFD